MKTARNIHVQGIVQGVGFRPFIYRLAASWSLMGWVLNASDGVHIHIEGTEASLDGFIDALPKQAPLAAHITALQGEDAVLENFTDFSIRQSIEQTTATTLISPDIATCPDCLRELFDKGDRRWHYPFINCTNCGPRFTIIDALPYDRPSTSMAAFEMCSTCGEEYHNPLDRRFHAQPDACFDCGPRLRLIRHGHTARTATNQRESDALIASVAELLKDGKIVAIKGLGGYHLACDATNEPVVALLRARKRRTAKPFALMVRNLMDAQALCYVNPHEAAVLAGTIRPIVLLERKGQKTNAPAQLASSVAGTLHELGVMLPSTPVQHLLMAAVDVPLVMTSGNISEEPIIAQEAEAHEALSGVADAFLDNDREILSRYDDSIVRVIGERTYLIRRARGYAPTPVCFPATMRSTAEKEDRGTVPLSCRKDRSAEPSPCPAILATGSEQKNTFCLIRGEEAFVSQHLGDLENASSFGAWLSTLTLYKRLFGLKTQVIACDKHPEYLSTKWAHAQDEARIEIQHHHAHIAAVLAEQRALVDGSGAGEIEQVIGIAFDGTGYGDDGTIWGGEILIASLEKYDRFAHLRTVPLPGGPAAILHPNRMAWSYLRSLGLAEHRGAAALAENIGEDRLSLLNQIIDKRINSPLCSSMGRLFDAISALAGICTESTYEGQAAVELEAALWDSVTDKPLDDPNPEQSAQRYRFSGFDPSPVFSAVLEDLTSSVSAALIALRFHDAVVRLIVEQCNAAREVTGLSTVALSGGVFMNRYLITEVIPQLESEGFTVLLNRALPANDGCISYGQAAICAVQLAQRAEQGILLGE